MADGENPPIVEEENEILLQFHDLSGFPRGMYINEEEWEQAQTDGFSFGPMVTEWVENYNTKGIVEPMQFTANEGYMNAIADPDTLVSVPWREGNCRKAICNLENTNGSDFELCTRSKLAKAVDSLAELGYEANVGSEIEFNLLTEFETDRLRTEGTDYIEEATTADLGAVYHLRPLEERSTYLSELNAVMKQMGYKIEGLHKESSPGMFEALLRYTDAVHQADAIATFRLSAQAIGRRHDLTPIFMPMPMSDYEGNSQHYHISLWQDGENAFYDPDGSEEVADVAYHFIGGVLEHAKGITVLCAPTVNSYKRLQPGMWAPINITYGHDNASAMIRIPTPREEGTRVEIRIPDNSANPYLSLAGILAAGADGIKNRINPGKPSEEDVYEADSDDYQQLPDSLGEAVDALNEDTFLCDFLGEELIDQFSRLKRDEARRYNQAVTDWEVREYINRM